jgi:hypothetical protein
MTAPAANAQTLFEIPDTSHYRVDVADATGCVTCGAGRYWTVVSGEGEDTIAIGTHLADQELTEDICDLMNMAYEAGKKAAADTGEKRGD